MALVQWMTMMSSVARHALGAFHFALLESPSARSSAPAPNLVFTLPLGGRGRLPSRASACDLRSALIDINGCCSRERSTSPLHTIQL